MLTQLAHTALLYFLPALIGGLGAWLFAGGHRRLFSHAVVCLGAIPPALCLQYAGFLIFAGFMTGSWPELLPPVGVLYGLAWFSIAGVFTTAPAVVAGYAVVTAGRQSPQPADAV